MLAIALMNCRRKYSRMVLVHIQVPPTWHTLLRELIFPLGHPT